jgi:hypothetical protein
MRPVVAHCHLGLSTIYRRAGAEDCAREHSLVAAGMCREMGIRIPAPGATLDR